MVLTVLTVLTACCSSNPVGPHWSRTVILCFGLQRTDFSSSCSHSDQRHRAAPR